MKRALVPVALLAFAAACGPKPEPLQLPDDPAETGVPVGVRTFSVGELVVEAWYPASDAVAGEPTEILSLAEWIPIAFTERVGEIDAPTLQTPAVRDAELRVPESPYPVVIFSHGLAAFRSQSIDLVTHLASRGYVVVATDHIGRSFPDLLPCVFDPAPDDCTLGTAFDDPAPPQVAEVVTWLEAANVEEKGFFEEALDLERLVLSGHSAGSSTTATVGQEDERFVALLQLAGARSITREVPVLAMGATCDTFVTDQDMREGIAGTATGNLVQIAGAGHLAFSDMCEMGLVELGQAHLEGRTDLNQFIYDILIELGSDGCPGHELPNMPQACLDSGYLPLATSDRIIRHYTTAFLDDVLFGRGPGAQAGVFPEAEMQ
ncbi:MAG: hypothetical protein P1V51_07445 [Deltaproteobacteria bacterium]|nr:hypothetical protein [Deltaproteobacteria bacterium]